VVPLGHFDLVEYVWKRVISDNKEEATLKSNPLVENEMFRLKKPASGVRKSVQFPCAVFYYSELIKLV